MSGQFAGGRVAGSRFTFKLSFLNEIDSFTVLFFLEEVKKIFILDHFVLFNMQYTAQQL